MTARFTFFMLFFSSQFLYSDDLWPTLDLLPALYHDGELDEIWNSSQKAIVQSLFPTPVYDFLDSVRKVDIPDFSDYVSLLFIDVPPFVSFDLYYLKVQLETLGFTHAHLNSYPALSALLRIKNWSTKELSQLFLVLNALNSHGKQVLPILWQIEKEAWTYSQFVAAYIYAQRVPPSQQLAVFSTFSQERSRFHLSLDQEAYYRHFGRIWQFLTSLHLCGVHWSRIPVLEDVFLKLDIDPERSLGLFPPKKYHRTSYAELKDLDWSFLKSLKKPFRF